MSHDIETNVSRETFVLALSSCAMFAERAGAGREGARTEQGGWRADGPCVLVPSASCARGRRGPERGRPPLSRPCPEKVREGRLLRCGTPGTSGMPEASGAAGEGKGAFAVRGNLRRSGAGRPVAPRALRSGSAACRTRGRDARKGRLAEDAAKARRVLRSLEGPYMILFEDHLRREGAFR